MEFTKIKKFIIILLCLLVPYITTANAQEDGAGIPPNPFLEDMPPNPFLDMPPTIPFPLPPEMVFDCENPPPGVVCAQMEFEVLPAEGTPGEVTGVRVVQKDS